MVSNYLLRSGLVLGLFLALSVTAQSQQLSKAKKKALKKELRKMSPEEYWELINQQQEQKVEILTLEKENESLRAQLAEQGEDLEMEQSKHEYLEGENVTMANQEASNRASTKPDVNTKWGEGVVFRVQIGALTKEEYEIGRAHV